MLDKVRGGAPYYRKDVDGLRAVAVLLVIFFHAGFSVFKGGFIGVDVFFVISGFVVSRAIQRGLTEGHFSFIGFYTARAKRLAPALYLTMGCVFVFALLYLMPDDAMRTLKTIGYASLLSANIYLAHKTDYFASQTSDQPLLHIWSLSVEEQFYLVLPALLVLSWRWSSGRRIAAFAFLAIVSLGASQWAASHATQGAYFLTPYRGFEFITGVLLSFRDERKTGHALADTAVAAGLAITVASGMLLSSSTPYPGWMALFPCVGAGLVVGFGSTSRLASVLLGNPATLFIGRISYSLYLWHWPVLFAFQRFGVDTTVWKLVAIVLSIGIGYLSYRYVETPLRYARMAKFRVVLTYVATPILCTLVLFVIGQRTDQFARLYPAAFQRIYTSARQSTWQNPRGRQCWAQVQLTDAAKCSLGDVSLPVNAAIWGDSHAYHLINFMDGLGKEYRLSIHDVAMPDCAPVARVPKVGDPSLKASQGKCAAHNQAVFNYLLSDKSVDTVFLSAVWEIYANAPAAPAVNDFGFAQGAFLDDLDDTISTLLRAGKHVVLFDDIPGEPKDLVNCQLYNHQWLSLGKRDCTYPSSEAAAAHRGTVQILASIAKKYPQVGLITLYDVPCDADRCRTSLDGVALYVANDFGHLNLASSAAYYDAYKARHPGQLQQVMQAIGRRQAGAAAASAGTHTSPKPASGS
ncbi:acyltransferase family protein [Dyella mobilis]|uniref:Acyltransferase n=1 Tax=Dyella mobilis TaxID=1849582 RepID=A0ABS2KGF8_9GAMM|nr:acyltransferase family protein [Dyella mobilis]MBM7130184.1 acyltransferase [Dyella mobilis]GLQ96810.1 acyltransferase [Dyella mobilis]